MKALNIKEELIIQTYKIIIKMGLRYGNVFASSNNFEGVMVFIPDEHAIYKTLNIIRSGVIIPALNIKRKLGDIMQQLIKLTDEDKSKLNIGAYFYLSVIGVAQEFQGKGFGGKMLRALINKSEKEGKSLYLETQNEQNVSLYEKFGFETIKTIKIPDLNLPIWEMVRKNTKPKSK